MTIFDSLDNFCEFWQFLTIFDNFQLSWQFMTIYDNFLTILTIFNNLDNFWQCWQFSTILTIFEIVYKIWQFWPFLQVFTILTILTFVYNFDNWRQFRQLLLPFWQFLTIQTIAFAILTIEKTILETCDIWDTDYNSDNWELEFMTIFVTWQLIVTLDSIRNSCDVYLKEMPV